MSTSAHDSGFTIQSIEVYAGCTRYSKKHIITLAEATRVLENQKADDGEQYILQG